MALLTYKEDKMTSTATTASVPSATPAGVEYHTTETPGVSYSVVAHEPTPRR